MFGNRKKEEAPIDAKKVFEEMIISTTQKLNTLELEVERLKTHISSLRGLVNRKLGNQEQEETKDDFYQGVLLKEKPK